jgi:hypothetical protein
MYPKTMLVGTMWPTLGHAELSALQARFLCDGEHVDSWSRGCGWHTTRPARVLCTARGREIANSGAWG